jgi:hypothetical protein
MQRSMAAVEDVEALVGQPSVRSIDKDPQSAVACENVVGGMAPDVKSQRCRILDRLMEGE